ncbi:MAG: filamentous hemagglutinin N-terminal domain-containing protein [Cyanobacteria bacterium SBLK]|nr:filamentous hemagglutinin N-terminal domain-containing protein [Cyanobacteria bacterium SBLK]
MTRWGVSLAIAFSASAAQAQIVPDGTLGGESSQLNPHVDLNGQLVDLIEGGAIRGNNLFHSFLEFNVNEGQRAYFSNPTDIFNIFSRVTGGHPSQILGTLGVNGGANLFLLNPNGILFGAHARLDIRGSFVATTADRFMFGNGLEYSAIAPQSPSPLLTINITPGLQYGSHGGQITNRGILETGGDLLLAGGNLDLQGQLLAGGDLTLRALDVLKIRDRETSAFVAAAGGALLVQGDRAVDIFALNHPDSGLFSGGNMTFRSANPVGGDAHYWSGGNFRIEQLDGSLGDLYSPKDPVIRTTGDVNFDSYLGFSLHIIAGGKVEIPNFIQIIGSDITNGLTEPITLSDGTSIVIDGKNKPTLDIRAGVNPALIGSPSFLSGGVYIPSTPSLVGTPSSADIKIGSTIFYSLSNQRLQGEIFLTNQYKPNNNLIGDIEINNGIDLGNTLDDGGNITVDSRRNINFNGSLITSSTVGNAGEIKFLTDNDISLTGKIESSAVDNAGNISFIAGGDISSHAAIESSANGGNAGNINLQSQTGNINILNGEIVSETFGSGNSGNLKITAGKNFTLTNLAEISARTRGAGNAGNVSVNARNILIQDEGTIVANTSSTGSGGDINLTASSINFERGFVFANSVRPPFALPDSVGDAGNINFNTQNLTLQNGTFISAFAQSEGRGGNINANVAGGTIKITGADVEGRASGFYLGTTDRGQGGNFNLNTSQLIIENRGLISADTIGPGNAGNVIINVDNLFLQSGGSISAATTNLGNAGTLKIHASNGIEMDGARSGLNLQSTNAGNAGGIKISTNGDLVVRNGASITVQGTGTGNPGDIEMLSRSLLLQNQGSITALTTSGEGANIQILSDAVTVRNNSQIAADTSGSGDAGDIRINVDTLFLSSNGLISAATTNIGDAGTLEINAKGSIEIEGEGSGLNLQSTNAGNAGGIKISTNGDLTMQNSVSITVKGTGAGNPGDIEISSRSLLLQNQGSITALTTSGEGANIQFFVQDSIVLRNNSEIVAEALGTGNGGNIRLEAGGFILAFLSENSDIVANALQGQGGNIDAKALGIFGFRQFRDRRTSESDFTASSQLGIDGVVTLDVGDFQPDVELPARPGVPRLNRGCPGNSRSRGGSNGEFYETGLGGVSSRPTDTLNSTSIHIPWIELESNTSELLEIPTEIREATGWKKLPSGEVILMGDRVSDRENQACYPLLTESP